MPQLVRRSSYQLPRTDVELLGPCQIPLAGGSFFQLGRRNFSQLCNPLTCHACFDPRNQWTPGHCALHPHEQRCPLLLTADEGQAFGAAHLLKIPCEGALRF